MRRPGVVLSQILAFVMIPVILFSGWLHLQVLDDGRYMESMQALGEDTSFQQSLGYEVLRLLYQEVDRLNDTTYGPVVADYAQQVGGIEVIKQEIANAVTSMINSPRFPAYWLEMNANTHVQLKEFLRGESSVIVGNDRYGVTLDLSTIAGWLDPYTSGYATEVLAFAAADGMVTIPIAESGSLPVLEWFARHSLPILILSLVLFVIAQFVAIALSQRRDRTTGFAMFGIGFAGLFTAVVAKKVVSHHLARITDLQGRNLAQEYVDAVMSDLVLYAGALAVVALIAGALIFSWPYIRNERPIPVVGRLMPQG